MIKQVIVLRTRYPDGRGGTFKPRLGKLSSQAAHASMKVFLDIAKQPIGGGTVHSDSPHYLQVPLSPQMLEWLQGTFTKICVGCNSEEELLALHQQALAAQLPVGLIQDSGKTEFGGVATYTCLAIGPDEADEIDKITGHLTLL